MHGMLSRFHGRAAEMDLLSRCRVQCSKTLSVQADRRRLLTPQDVAEIVYASIDRRQILNLNEISRRDTERRFTYDFRQCGIDFGDTSPLIDDSPPRLPDQEVSEQLPGGFDS